MSVNRIESIYIKPVSMLSHHCHTAKNLYNEANYIIRQTFFKEGKWVRYNELDKTLKNSENYKQLPAQSSQQVLRLLDKNWKSFFNSMKAWKKNKTAFTGQPNLPKYRPKDGEFILPFTNQQIKLKNKKLVLPQKIGLEVKTRLKDNTKLRGARIVPMGIGYQLEIIYEVNAPKQSNKSKRIAGIDLGVNNLATIGTNIAIVKPIVVKGGAVKSWNQYYNKEKANIQSIYDHQKIKEGIRMNRLCLKRKFKLKDFFHKTSRAIIDWCKKNRIDTIVVGRNKGWKQEANMSKKSNQNFVSVPFDMLRSQLAYKAEDAGIKVIEVEESYTSKCSFLDLEAMEHHEHYIGKRIKRGLFRAKDGRLINADLNGAYNIIRKAFPKAFTKGIEGLGMAPRRLSI